MSTQPGFILPGAVSHEALRALVLLEQGDWRTAASLAAELGRLGRPVRLLALSMRERTFGTVGDSWEMLGAAAASCPPERCRKLGSIGPGDVTTLPWPTREKDEFWARFAVVGRREEDHARSQWFRIEDARYPKRTSLIEACIDHLTWVFFDGSTWQAPHAGEWLPSGDRVTRGKLAEDGREYYLRRANELHHSVYPFQGSLTRKVWDDLGMYRGVYEAAWAALAERDDGSVSGVVQRSAHALAVDCARRLVQR